MVGVAARTVAAAATAAAAAVPHQPRLDCVARVVRQQQLVRREGGGTALCTTRRPRGTLRHLAATVPATITTTITTRHPRATARVLVVIHHPAHTASMCLPQMCVRAVAVVAATGAGGRGCGCGRGRGQRGHGRCSGASTQLARCRNRCARTSHNAGVQVAAHAARGCRPRGACTCGRSNTASHRRHRGPPQRLVRCAAAAVLLLRQHNTTAGPQPGWGAAVLAGCAPGHTQRSTGAPHPAPAGQDVTTPCSVVVAASSGSGTAHTQPTGG